MGRAVKNSRTRVHTQQPLVTGLHASPPWSSVTCEEQILRIHQWLVCTIICAPSDLLKGNPNQHPSPVTSTAGGTDVNHRGVNPASLSHQATTTAVLKKHANNLLYNHQLFRCLYLLNTQGKTLWPFWMSRFLKVTVHRDFRSAFRGYWPRSRAEWLSWWATDPPGFPAQVWIPPTVLSSPWERSATDTFPDWEAGTASQEEAWLLPILPKLSLCRDWAEKKLCMLPKGHWCSDYRGCW